jgi:pyruvate/oxaloacetate carboxyltransferase/biotin carboxyl carrier protein
MRRIALSDTTLSDSTHTLRKSPLSTDDLLPLAEAMDAVGFASAEVWGGATFDTCLRHFNLDPWDRLRLLSGRMTHTPLRIIIRGQNLLGYHAMPLDVIRAFALEIARNGIRVARVFDSLNDVGNLEPVVAALKEAGVEPQGAIVYTQSPVHSIERFAEDAARLVAMGCTSICVNDIAGILTPPLAREIVHAFSPLAPVTLHSRSMTGMGAMAYRAALEVGAVGVDCAIGPFAIAAAQPTVEVMLEAFQELGLDAGVDRAELRKYTKLAEQTAVKHSMHDVDQHLYQGTLSVHKIPIGMLTGLISDLRAIASEKRLGEVLAEVIRVREDFGWPPLITPMSQLVSGQAIQNVMTGTRYGVMSREVKDYLRGMYGTPPGEVNPALTHDLAPVTGRASLLLPPLMDRLEEELARDGFLEKKEDIITYALFGPLALSFFRFRKDPHAPRKVTTVLDNRLVLLTSFMNRRKLRKLEVTGREFRVKLVKRSAAASPVMRAEGVDETFEEDLVDAPSDEREEPQGTPVAAPLGGTFYRSPGPGQPHFIEPGAEVAEETVIGLIEAMKLFHEVKAEKAGVLKAFAVENGALVDGGRPLAWIELRS